jgi:negative regulator of sigma E activity
MNDAIKMQISAFVDGELPQNEAELLLRRLCQDGELRQQAAEYMAMGRAMRGERRVAGMGKLRNRILAALDETPLQEESGVTESVKPRFLRPLAGVAIAATVALAAILGLQQMSAVPDVDPAAGTETIAESVQDSAYTVPDQVDDQLRDYYLRHSETSSYFGASSINPRIVTVQFDVDAAADLLEQPVDEDEADSAETPDVETP